MPAVRLRTPSGWQDLAVAGAPGQGSTVPIEAWKTPAFENSWGSHSASYPVQYRKRPDGIVELRGLLKSGTINARAFVLPVGYQPAPPGAALYFAAASEDGVGNRLQGMVWIGNQGGGLDGQVVPFQGSSAGWFSLGGIAFSTEQAAFPTGPQGPTGPVGPVTPLVLVAGSHSSPAMTAQTARSTMTQDVSRGGLAVVNNQVTIPTAGIYRLGVSITLQNANAGQWAAGELRRNGSGVVNSHVHNTVAALWPSSGATRVMELAANDVITSWAGHSDSASRTAAGYWSIERIGD